VQGQQPGVDRADQDVELGLDGRDLISQGCAPEGEAFEGLAGDITRFHASRVGVSAGQSVQQLVTAQCAVGAAHGFGSGHQQCMDLVDGLPSGLDGRAALAGEYPKRLGLTVGALGNRAVGAGQHGQRGPTNVDGVGLASESACLPVLANHLHDHEARGCEHPGDPGSIRAGAFDTDTLHVTVRPEELHQLGVALSSRDERAIRDVAPQMVQHRDVVSAFVSIDSGDHQQLIQLVAAGQDTARHGGPFRR